jgi:glycosyltransferase involved in cell wall biosynthesis
VSVIIPCYNQAYFLREAIESVLQQTYPHFEIVVVDDGSTDGTSEVASSFPGVRTIHQENRGSSAARNVGLSMSTGYYVVFLDADDRLLPIALETNVDCLGSHPDCALAAGQYRTIAADGTVLERPQQRYPQHDHYLELLRRCHIAVPAPVMHRRDVLDSVGGFDASFQRCMDYDLYLRIAREFWIVLHDTVVAEYRQHPTSATRKSALMLASNQAVLRAQLPYIKGNKRYEEAYKIGMKAGREYWGRALSKDVRACIESGAWNQALEGALKLLWLAPRVFMESFQYLPRHVTRWLGIRQ